MSGFHIVDPRPIRDTNPHSFHIPCQARLDAIAAGDFVKAIFEPSDGGGGERMWIKVDSTDGDILRGTLANDPLGDMGMSHGDPVEIRRHEVINIETTRADDPEETDDKDHLFDRCLVDTRIERGMPIARIVRDEPQPKGYAQGFPWSGWRFEAEGYETGMETEMYALVVPLRIEDGYVDRLKDPHGTTLVRDGDDWRALETVH